MTIKQQIIDIVKAGPGLSSSQIANLIMVKKNTVHATLCKLEDKKLVKRIPRCGPLGGAGWEITYIQEWADRLRKT